MLVKFLIFLGSRLIFNIFYCFWMFVNKLFTYSRVHISKNKTCLNAKSSAYYLHMKTKILPDFWICISVPNITSQTLKICILHLYAFWNILQLGHFSGVFYINSRCGIVVTELNDLNFAGILKLPNFCCKFSLDSVPNILKNEKPSKDQEIQQEIVL